MCRSWCLLFVVISSACGGVSPGGEGSASGDFGVAYVGAASGAFEVRLGDLGVACDSRASRTAFDLGSGLRIRLLAVDQTGALSRVDGPRYYEPMVNGGRAEPQVALNEFAAAMVPEREAGERFDSDLMTLASDGEVTLSRVPDYDSGEVAGSYRLIIDGEEFSGEFDTAYCPTGDQVDAAGLGGGLWSHCDLTPDVPYQPGSDPDTLERDLGRGVEAMGLFNDDATCMQGHVDRYCRDGERPAGWDQDFAAVCIELELESCVGGPGLSAQPTLCGG